MLSGEPAGIVLEGGASAASRALQLFGAESGAWPERLADELAQRCESEILAHWYLGLARLHAHAALEYQIVDGIVMVPHKASWQFPVAQLVDDSVVSLSRFSHLRIAGGTLVLESPVGAASLMLEPGAAVTALLARLATPVRAADCASQHGAVARELLDALHAAGLIAVHADGVSSDDTGPLVHWSFGDAIIHAATRLGGHPARIGRKDGSAPSSPVHEFAMATYITLPPVELTAAASRAPRLDDALSDRRSRRDYSPRVLHVRSLGELLARSCRETQHEDAEGRGIFRLYPSGGACHPLDVWVAISRCDGLGPGLYRYDRSGHALGFVTASADDAQQLVRAARRAAARDDDGHALLLFAADFAKTSARYHGIAYALMLKEVGAAMQTVHIVGEAIGLAVCPIGSGDSAQFARAVGGSFFGYSSVGEMLVGASLTSYWDVE